MIERRDPWFHPSDKKVVLKARLGPDGLNLSEGARKVVHEIMKAGENTRRRKRGPKGGGAPEENWEHETQRYRQASGELRLTAATQPHSAQNVRKLLLQLRMLVRVAEGAQRIDEADSPLGAFRPDMGFIPGWKDPDAPEDPDSLLDVTTGMYEGSGRATDFLNYEKGIK